MTSLLLLRHAESEWNAEGRWQGVADPPLSPRGEAQAQAAGPLLRPMGITVVVSSDLQRARATAQRVAPALALRAPIATDAGLREYDLGAWSGLTRSQIEAGWPGDIEAWREGRLFATPGGEQRNLFLERIRAALARVADAWPEERVLVVTHGGVISAVARDLGQPARRFTHLAGLWLDAGTEPWRAQAEVSLLGPARPASDQGEGIEVAQAGVMDTRGR